MSTRKGWPRWATWLDTCGLRYLARSEIPELGMVESDVAAGVSAIQKGIDKSLNSIENFASGKRNAEAPLMTTLERALQNNRGVRRYFGERRLTKAISMNQI